MVTRLSEVMNFTCTCIPLVQQGSGAGVGEGYGGEMEVKGEEGMERDRREVLLVTLSRPAPRLA